MTLIDLTCKQQVSGKLSEIFETEEYSEDEEGTETVRGHAMIEMPSRMDRTISLSSLLPKNSSATIVISGASLRFAGGISSLDALHFAGAASRELHKAAPFGRFDADRFHHPDPTNVGFRSNIF